MAINTGMGFKVGNAEPIDARLVLSKAQMLAVNPIAQPEKYFCVCSDDSLMYVYDVNNEDDPETGKFRPISASNEPIDLSEYQKISDDTLTTDDKTIPGAINELDSNKVNIPEIDGLENDVLTRDADGNIVWKAIPETDITGKLDKPAVDGTTGQILVLQDNGTLAYQDNVTEYDDTAIQEALDTKLDKEKVIQNLDAPDAESVLSTEATQAALDTKVDKVDGSSLVPDTKIAKIHEHVNMTTLDKFSENALGELLYNGNLIASSDPEGDAGAEGDWITNTKIGNLAAGTDVTGLTAIQIWKLATVAYENPTASVSYSQTNTLIENGQTFNLDITVSNVKKGTGEVSKIDLYKDGALVESLPYTDGTASYSFTQIADISTDTSIEVRVYDDADKYAKYTKSYDFVNPYYHGCLDDIPVDATGMTKLVEAKGTKTITTTTSADGQYVTFMYDAAYGNLSSILDPNGFEYLTGFTKIQLTINGVQYNCYYSTLKQVLTNFKYTYKY